MKITQSKLKLILNSREFKRWIFEKRWFGNKSYLSDFDFSISLSHFEDSGDLFLCIIRVEKGEYFQEYFIPFVFSNSLEEIISSNGKQKEIESFQEAHSFNLNIANSKDRKNLSSVFLIEGEYTLKYWSKIFSFYGDMSKYPKLDMKFRTYSKSDLRTIIKPIISPIAGKKRRFSDKNLIKQLGNGNTTNLLFKFQIPSNMKDSKGNSYLFKCYKKYEKNVEPRVLRTLKKNNFKGSASIFGEVIYKNITLICILEYLQNDGNIGSIFWTELNEFCEFLIKNNKDSPNHNTNEVLRETMNQICDTSFGISQQIGEEIKKMHKALIDKNKKDFSQIDIKKSIFLKDLSIALEDLNNQIRNEFEKKRWNCYNFLNQSQLIQLIEKSKEYFHQKFRETEEDHIKVQRIHQDLHMEQILYKESKNGGCVDKPEDYNYYFLDFEGDPQFSSKKKQNKFPIERDLATLVRSLGYIKFNTIINKLDSIISQEKTEYGKMGCLYHVIFRKKHLKELKDLKKLKIILDKWEKRIKEAIIQSFVLDKDLLEIFRIERILRELNYEIKYRPKDMMIPIFGLKEFLEKRIC
ncbi:MAG: hypothetical protein R6U96_01660 [Promethearchaeia archaeon]